MSNKREGISLKASAYCILGAAVVLFVAHETGLTGALGNEIGDGIYSIPGVGPHIVHRDSDPTLACGVGKQTLKSLGTLNSGKNFSAIFEFNGQKSRVVVVPKNDKKASSPTDFKLEVAPWTSAALPSADDLAGGDVSHTLSAPFKDQGTRLSTALASTRNGADILTMGLATVPDQAGKFAVDGSCRHTG